MKKYRSLALICALALTLTGCKSQSIPENSNGATNAVTVEASSDYDAPTTTAATTTAATTTTEVTTTQVTTVAEPDIDAVYTDELQSYTIGNDLATFTFDAPAGLEFDEDNSSIDDITLFESYAYHDSEDYTIGAVLVDFDYTLGQPQELLDYLGYPGGFNIKTEFFSDTTKGGIAYDLVVLELYTDENMQEYSSVGMVGFYPMQNGVLFFGYEMNSQENYEYYYTTQKQTLNSLVIKESTYTKPDTELSGEFQTVVCENEGCCFPVPKEFEYSKDGSKFAIWSGATKDHNTMVAAYYEPEASYADIMEQMKSLENSTAGTQTSVFITDTSNNKYSLIETKDPSYHSLNAVYDAGVGLYLITYSTLGEFDDETRELITMSFDGFKGNINSKPEQPDTELSDELRMVVCEDYSCTFPIPSYYRDSQPTSSVEFYHAISDDGLFYAHFDDSRSYNETMADLEHLNDDDVIYSKTSDGIDFVIVKNIYDDPDSYDRTPIMTTFMAIYPAEKGLYQSLYVIIGDNDHNTELILESFKGFKILD